MNNREEVLLCWKQKNQITSNVNMKKLMYEQQRGSTTVLETEKPNVNMKKLMYEQQRGSTTV
jgi:phosphatidylserine decarboxylase